ncbi:MAG: sulfotransferase [Xanthomonadales bacterium]|nr:sulfotransferase [Xanthomonadales bacterium]
MSRIRPVFIFSLPRSGSTLLQRAVATHPSIATISEPWVLLPVLYYLKDRGVYAEYAHLAARQARRDLLEALPDGEADYLAAMREGVLELYQRLAGPEATHFVDKTPRYHLVCEEIIRMFPDASFVFLWRNPLSVLASLSRTWGEGRWNAFRFEVDLERGLPLLIEAYQKHRERTFALRFEDLVADPRAALDPLFEYLGLAPRESAMHDFSATELEGELGDQAGVKAYSEISTEPVSKWPETIHSAYRVSWCKRYLRRIGEHRLAVMGYELDALLAALDEVPQRLSALPADLGYGLYGAAYGLVKKLALRLGKVQ